jgi:hypothetical protein
MSEEAGVVNRKSTQQFTRSSKRINTILKHQTDLLTELAKLDFTNPIYFKRKNKVLQSIFLRHNIPITPELKKELNKIYKRHKRIYLTKGNQEQDFHKLKDELYNIAQMEMDKKMQYCTEAPQEQIELLCAIKEWISTAKSNATSLNWLKDTFSSYGFDIDRNLGEELDSIHKDKNSTPSINTKKYNIALFMRLSAIVDSKREWQTTIQRKKGQSDELFKDLRTLTKVLFFYQRSLLEALQNTFEKHNVTIGPDIINELQIEVKNIADRIKGMPLQGRYSIFCNEVYETLSNIIDRQKEENLVIDKSPREIILEHLKQWSYAKSDSGSSSLKLLIYIFRNNPNISKQDLQDIFNEKSTFLRTRKIHETKGFDDIYSKLKDIVDTDMQNESPQLTAEQDKKRKFLNNIKEWAYLNNSKLRRSNNKDKLIEIFFQYLISYHKIGPDPRFQEQLNNILNEIVVKKCSDKRIKECFVALCNLADTTIEKRNQDLLNQELLQEEHKKEQLQDPSSTSLMRKFYKNNPKSKLINLWKDLPNNNKILFIQSNKLSCSLNILYAIENDPKLVTELWSMLEESHSTIAKIKNPEKILSILTILEKTNLDLYINFWSMLPEEMQKKQGILWRDEQFKHHSGIIDDVLKQPTLNLLQDTRNKFKSTLSQWVRSHNSQININKGILKEDSLIIIFSKYLKVFEPTLDPALETALRDIVKKRQQASRWSERLKGECFLELLKLYDAATEKVVLGSQKEDQKMSSCYRELKRYINGMEPAGLSSIETRKKKSLL